MNLAYIFGTGIVHMTTYKALYTLLLTQIT